MYRVGAMGFLHESNTFLDVPTTWEDFASTSMPAGGTMRARWQGPIMSLAECCPRATPKGSKSSPDLQPAPCPGARSARGAWNELLVALHGATVSENYRDADGEVLTRLRALVGPVLPLVVTIDLHANLSALLWVPPRHGFLYT